MSEKAKNVCRLLVIIGLLLWLGGQAIHDNSNAKHLKQVCTATMMGRYYKSERNRISSNHNIAYYVIDNQKYYTKGMDHGEGVGFDIIIHYNPENVAESYCGQEPVRTGLMEGALLAVLVACFVGYVVLILKNE